MQYQQLHDFWSQRVELEKSAATRFNLAYQKYYGYEPLDLMTSYEPGQYISPQRRFASPYMVDSSYTNPSNPNTMRNHGAQLKHDPLYGIPESYHYSPKSQYSSLSSRLRAQTPNESKSSRQKRDFYERLNTGYAFGGRSHIKLSQHPSQNEEQASKKQETNDKPSIFGQTPQSRPKSAYSAKGRHKQFKSPKNILKKAQDMNIEGQKIETEDVLKMIENTRSDKVDQKLGLVQTKRKQSSRESLGSASHKKAPKLARPQTGGGKKRINPEQYRTHLQEFQTPKEKKYSQTVDIEPMTVDKMLQIKNESKRSSKVSKTSRSRISSVTDYIKKMIQENQQQKEETLDQEQEQKEDNKIQEEIASVYSEGTKEEEQQEVKSLVSEQSASTGRVSSYVSSSAMRSLYQMLMQEKQKREQLEKLLINYIGEKDK